MQYPFTDLNILFVHLQYIKINCDEVPTNNI